MNDYTIKTPEQVSISYTVAGLGTRFLALLIDTIIQYTFLVILLVSVWMMFMDDFSDNFTEWYLAIIIIAFGLINGVYFIFFEFLLKGRTPGKAALRLRVVRKDGRAVDFAGILIRNLLRIIDYLPVMYGIGIIAIFVNKDCRRLGDIVGGTVVIAEGKKASLGSVLNLPAKNTNELSDHEYALIRDYISRRNHLVGPSRMKLAAQLAAPLYDRFDIPEEKRGNPEQFLADLLTAAIDD